MGSKTINWCDCCGRESEDLRAFWFGQPAEFEQHRDSISCYNEMSLCNVCIDEIKTTLFGWIKYKENPKSIK